MQLSRLIPQWMEQPSIKCCKFPKSLGDRARKEPLDQIPVERTNKI